MSEISVVGALLGALGTIVAAALAAWAVVYAARRTDRSRLEELQAASVETERKERVKRDAELIDQWRTLNQETRDRAAAAEAAAKRAETRADDLSDELASVRDRFDREARITRAALAFIGELVALWPNTNPLPLIPLELAERVDPAVIARFNREHPPRRNPRGQEKTG